MESEGRLAGRVRLMQMTAIAALCVAPQLLVYKRATGHWFVSVYGQLGRFDFTSPRLASVTLRPAERPVVLVTGSADGNGGRRSSAIRWRRGFDRHFRRRLR